MGRKAKTPVCDLCKTELKEVNPGLWGCPNEECEGYDPNMWLTGDKQETTEHTENTEKMRVCPHCETKLEMYDEKTGIVRCFNNDCKIMYFEDADGNLCDDDGKPVPVCEKCGGPMSFYWQKDEKGSGRNDWGCLNEGCGGGITTDEKTEGVEVKKTTMDLPCVVNRGELDQDTKKMCEEMVEKEKFENQKKSLSESYGNLIKAKQVEIDRLRQVVASGLRVQKVDCEERFDFAAGKVTVVRLDTNETVEIREMEPEERQATFELLEFPKREDGEVDKVDAVDDVDSVDKDEEDGDEVEIDESEEVDL